MAKEKVNLYLLAIVAIVAVVGIVVLILNAGTTALSVSDDDLTGQVAGAAPRMQTRTCDYIECGSVCCAATQGCVYSGGKYTCI